MGWIVVLNGKRALLLDMNGTFMFGGDRFSEGIDYSLYYRALNGWLSNEDVNTFVWHAFQYLEGRYLDATYRERFPSVETAFRCVVDKEVAETEVRNLVTTFAFHELGRIPKAYASALVSLKAAFDLGAVIDIWAPKPLWLRAFQEAGIHGLFSAVSFSSDCGMVKPSPKPYEVILRALAVSPAEALVVGDSVERDLLGAKNAGIECVLVGGATHPDAVGQFENLLEFCRATGFGALR